MKFFCNILLARIGLIAAIFLSIIYVLRIVHQRYGGNAFPVGKINRCLRKIHKPLGIALIATGLLHGLLSSQPVLSVNLGTICFLFSVLLGLNWLVRDRLRNKGWIYYHRILTLLFIVTLAYHIIDVGGFTSEYSLIMKPAVSASDVLDDSGTLQENGVQGQNDSSEEQRYKDGTYTGEATGFRPGLKVQVTVKNGKITDIQIIEHNEENYRFYGLPMQIIPQEIIENQSTDVDVVSGATKTSKGIMKAVESALSKAAE